MHAIRPVVLALDGSPAGIAGSRKTSAPPLAPERTRSVPERTKKYVRYVSPEALRCVHMHCVFCTLCIHWITRVGDVRRRSSVVVSYFFFLARLFLVLLATCWVSPVFVWVPAHAVHLPISFGTEVRRDALFNSSCSTSGVIRCVGMDLYRILCTSVLYPRAAPRDRAPSSSPCSRTAFSSSACSSDWVSILFDSSCCSSFYFCIFLWI